ncbi:MAG: class I SAM-dependent methyltransferase [Planctomycetota bacterium]|jgi:O-methyltransferase involved in polyketide biosynthesis
MISKLLSAPVNASHERHEHLQKVAVNLGLVQETLLVPLWARAMECQQPIPILEDVKSREILESLDYDFSILSKATASQIGCCVRGRLVDGWVREFIAENPEGTVVELGCGLNSRFRRVDNGHINWIDLDLPDTMHLRDRFFSNHSRVKSVTADLRKSDWQNELPEVVGPVFFVSEGVLVYLDSESVRQLFAGLTEKFTGSQIVFDTMTPLIKNHQKSHDAMRYFPAPFEWTVKRPNDVETWDSRYDITDSQNFFDMLFEYRKRLPRVMRTFGPFLGRLLPFVRNSYHINRMTLGATGTGPASGTQ